MINTDLLDSNKRTFAVHGGGRAIPAESSFVPPMTAPNNPLVIVKSPDQIELERQQAENANKLPPRVVSELASHIRKQFELAQRARQQTETEMLEDLRQRKGEYDAGTKALIEKYNQPLIFDNITETKCYAAESWIKDILIFQSNDKAWGLTPTPKPDISPDEEARVVETTLNKVAQLIAMNGRFPSEQEVYNMARALRVRMEKQIENEAKDRSERMEEVIEDKLAEGDYDEAWNDFIYYFTTFSCAFLKGPVIQKRKKPVWGPDADGRMAPQIQEELVETFEAINPLDVYPCPLSVETGDGFIIERKRLSPQSVRKMVGMRGYNQEALKAVLEKYDSGGLRIWTAIDAERSILEDKDQSFDLSNFIECLEYWDEIDGKLLNQWEGPDSQKYEDGRNYSIMAELIGDEVVRVVLNPDPTDQKSYFKACFRKVAGSFWGKSLPRLIADEQKQINSLARACIKNSGQAAGPQAEVDNSRLAPGEDVTAIHPDKIWQTESRGVNYSQPAVKFFQPTLIALTLMDLRDRISKQADDKSGVPPYSYGNEQQVGAGRTLGGLQLLMSSAAKGIRNAIHAIDIGVMKPLVKRMWTFEMLYNEDESIKGDVNIVARGAMALFIKDQVSARRNELLAMTSRSPVALQLIGPEGLAKLLRQTFEAADIDPEGIIPSDEQLREAARAQAAVQPGAQQPPQQMVPANAGV